MTERNEVTPFQSGMCVPSRWPWGQWLGPVALAWLAERAGLGTAGGPWGLGAVCDKRNGLILQCPLGDVGCEGQRDVGFGMGM